MKKLLTIIIGTLLVLVLFTSCIANKPADTLTPDPPTGTTTKTEVVPGTEKKEEIKTTLPEKTEKLEEKSTVAPQKEVAKEKATFTKEDKTTEKSTKQNRPTEKITEKKPVSTTKKELNISRDEAKAIALGHAGLAETDIRHYKAELDRERKAIVYEIEFDSGKYEYEYEINADTGKVIKAEKEFRD